MRFFREEGVAAELARLVEPVLESLGFRLVRIQVSGRQGQTVQVMAERPDGTMNIDDCETVSRNLSPLLDTVDLLSGSYHLEVSSPGIDRPLVRPSDFETWAGHEAKVELKALVDGRKRFRGIIDGYEGDEARIACEIEGAGTEVLGFPIALVADARLVLTDELVREALRRSKARTKDSPAPGGTGDGTEVD